MFFGLPIRDGRNYLLTGDGIHTIEVNKEERDGTISVSLYSRKLKTEQWMMDELSDGRLELVRDVFSVAGARAHLKSGRSYQYITVEVPHITLNANFEAVDGLILPKFVKKDAIPSLPLRPQWVPPSGCRVRFLVQITALQVSDCYLVAFDADGKAFRLPLPNIFEDCKVCMGGFENRAPNIHRLVNQAVDQFFGSPWNTDLLDDDKLRQCRELFRWKAEGDQLVQQLPTDNWSKLCEKVAPATLDKFTL